MSQEDDERPAVESAVLRFYAAIEDMVAGRGLDAMRAAWHHGEDVTSKHPSGNWAVGWDEVWATWNIFSQFGRADRGGSKLVDLAARRHGDVAYATVVFQAAPAWGSERLMCTNVLRRVDGEWKVVHHHADSGPEMQRALERILAE